MMRLGTLDTADLRVGEAEVSKVCLGGETVWERGGFDPTLGYVSSGLVAMWDGAHNTGGKRHDGSAAVWTDLIGGLESATLDNQVWSSDGLSVTTPTLYLVEDGASDLLPGKPYTVEMVAEEVVQSAASNAGGGINVMNTHQLGFFRHQNNNAWGPAGFKVLNYYVTMQISGLTYNQTYPTASKSFVVANYTPTSANNARNAASVYYNGVLRSTHLYSFASGSAPSSTETIRIHQTTSGTIKYYNIRIYNRALTAEEIAANCAVDVERFGITV